MITVSEHFTYVSLGINEQKNEAYFSFIPANLLCKTANTFLYKSHDSGHVTPTGRVKRPTYVPLVKGSFELDL